MDDLHSAWSNHIQLLKEFARECILKRPGMEDEIESQAWAFYRMPVPSTASQLTLRLAAMSVVCRSWNKRVEVNACRRNQVDEKLATAMSHPTSV